MAGVGPATGGTRAAGVDRVGALVAEYAWAAGTIRSRGSQWRAYLEFCTVSGRSAVPVTASKVSEGALLAYIGWLADEHEAGRRNVAPASLAQYVSCVRTMHKHLTGQPMADMPYLTVATRAYGMWYVDARRGPGRQRRGVAAGTLQGIWVAAMAPDADLRTVQAAALLLTTYCLGLRASSAVSILAEHVECSPAALRVRLSVWKGRAARELTPACYLRVAPDLPSPLDLLLRWAARRPPSALWFDLPGAPPLTSDGLTQVLRSAVLRHGGDALHLSSHSLRIGAHTEQVMLGIPLEIRKARFGWAPNSPMECVYIKV